MYINGKVQVSRALHSRTSNTYCFSVLIKQNPTTTTMIYRNANLIYLMSIYISYL